MDPISSGTGASRGAGDSHSAIDGADRGADRGKYADVVGAGTAARIADDIDRARAGIADLHRGATGSDLHAEVVAARAPGSTSPGQIDRATQGSDLRSVGQHDSPAGIAAGAACSAERNGSGAARKLCRVVQQHAVCVRRAGKAEAAHADISAAGIQPGAVELHALDVSPRADRRRGGGSSTAAQRDIAAAAADHRTGTQADGTAACRVGV